MIRWWTLMTTNAPLLAVSFLATLLIGCTPDLVVSSLETTGPPSVNAENSVEVPIRVVVENQGTGTAGDFKTCVHYTDADETFSVSFTVPGQDDLWYPYTNAPLNADAETTFSGIVTFHPSVHDQTVSLHATADCCGGNEFMPDACRVDESDEDNNQSETISVSLP